MEAGLTLPIFSFLSAIPSSLALTEYKSTTSLAIWAGSQILAWISRPLEKLKNAFTNNEVRSIFRTNISMPCWIRSMFPLAKPEFNINIPPSRAVIRFLTPWDNPATVWPTAARRSASIFSFSSCLISRRSWTEKAIPRWLSSAPMSLLPTRRTGNASPSIVLTSVSGR